MPKDITRISNVLAEGVLAIDVPVVNGVGAEEIGNARRALFIIGHRVIRPPVVQFAAVPKGKRKRRLHSMSVLVVDKKKNKGWIY